MCWVIGLFFCVLFLQSRSVGVECSYPGLEVGFGLRDLCDRVLSGLWRFIYLVLKNGGMMDIFSSYVFLGYTRCGLCWYW